MTEEKSRDYLKVGQEAAQRKTMLSNEEQEKKKRTMIIVQKMKGLWSGKNLTTVKHRKLLQK